AYAHIQIARLRMDHGAGRRKAVVTDGLEKDLGSSDVAGTRALQRHEPDATKGPVEQEESAAKALGKLSVPVANDPRRRATAKRRHRRGHVDEVWRQTPPLSELRIEPAVVSARQDLVESRRFIPRQGDAALVVRVEGEQLALGAKVHVVGIAKTVGD